MPFLAYLGINMTNSEVTKVILSLHASKIHVMNFTIWDV